MRRTALRRFVYALAGWTQMVAGVVWAAVTGALVSNPLAVSEWSPMSGIVVEGLRDASPVLLPCTIAALAAMPLVRQRVGKPWVAAAVHDILDGLQDWAFSDSPKVFPPNHRVTLFKYVPRAWWPLRKWPWSGWLVPFDRSGYMSRRNVPSFKAPDDPDDVEGVAGFTWAHQQTIVVADLPDVRNSTKPDDLATYARRTFVSEDWIASRKPSARCYCGIPIEINGRMWGALVLTSKDGSALEVDNLKAFRLIAPALGKLLKEV